MQTRMPDNVLKHLNLEFFRNKQITIVSHPGWADLNADINKKTKNSGCLQHWNHNNIYKKIRSCVVTVRFFDGFQQFHFKIIHLSVLFLTFSHHPLAPSVFHSRPVPLTWISNTNTIPFGPVWELHHAVRGKWAAESNRSWMYCVKILMEWSQSPSQTQPNARVNSVWTHLDRAFTHAFTF